MRSDDEILRRVTLRELRVFAAAVACGTVAKAARELGLTQPAASKAIASLESALGTQLVERSATGVQPTAAGRIVLERSGGVFDELRQAANELEVLSDPRGGELNIGASAALSAGLLPAVLARLQQQRPAVRPFTLEGDQRLLFRELLARALDLALMRAPDPAVEEPEIAFEKLFDERLLVVVPLAHALAGRRSVSLAELVGERWILPPPDTYLGRMIRSAFERRGVGAPRACMTTMSILARFELLESGGFVTTLPESLLRFSRAHPPVAILAVEPLLNAPVGIARLKRRAVSPVVRLFIECAREMTAGLQPLEPRALHRLARGRGEGHAGVYSSDAA